MKMRELIESLEKLDEASKPFHKIMKDGLVHREFKKVLDERDSPDDDSGDGQIVYSYYYTDPDYPEIEGGISVAYDWPEDEMTIWADIEKIDGKDPNRIEFINGRMDKKVVELLDADYSVKTKAGMEGKWEDWGPVEAKELEKKMAKFMKDTLHDWPDLYDASLKNVHKGRTAMLRR